MHNRSLYGIKSINYIKNLLLDFNFTSSSVCIFLYHMQNSLDYEYLDKIIDKYGCFPSVLFCVGHFHRYKKDDPNPLFRLGYNYNDRVLYRRTVALIGSCIGLFTGFFIGFVIDELSYIGIFENNRLLVLNTLIRAMTILFLSVVVIILAYRVTKYAWKLAKKRRLKLIHKYLLSKKDLEESIIEDIIEDMNYIYLPINELIPKPNLFSNPQ